MRFQLDPLSATGVSIAPETPKLISKGGYAGSPDITRVIQPGANVTFTGQGTQQSPYIVNSSGGGGGSISDGDKGDITVSGSGTVWTIDSGLPATRIGTGTVDNTELSYLDGVTSAIQTQLNGKQATITNSDSITQGSTNLFLTTAERTKLTNTSGTNTGDQTITLTGDVTGSGTGSFVTTIKTDAALAGNPTTTTQTAGNNTTRIATTAFVTTAVGAVIAAADALVYKGVIDASANPNYPAADAGWTYKISVAGKIGGASGINVEVGDMLLCTTDGTASGNQVTVGANWTIIQANIDGAVVGPSSSTSGDIVTFSGTSGKVVQDSGKTLPSGSILGTTDVQTVTNKDLTSGTNTYPTFNQNTTGSAAKLTTARTINGVSFDGTANITVADTTRLHNLGVTSSQSVSFTAVINTRYSVDCTAGAVTATLPTTATIGDVVFVQKSDASTNVLTLSGNINGTAASSLPIRTQLQGKLLQWDGVSTWNVIAGDISLPALDARFVSTSGVTAGTNVTITGSGTSGAPFVINASGAGGGTTITNNYNTIKTDIPSGTSPYGALSGLINGSNTLFTVSNGSYVAGTLMIFQDNVWRQPGNDFSETTPASGTFTFTTAPTTGDFIAARYVTQNTTSGNAPLTYATKTTTYSMTASTDYGILANATTGAFSVTPPATTTAGYEVIIKKIDSGTNAVTVAGTIDGVTNYSLPSQNKYVRLVTTGTSGTFYIVGNN